MQKFVLSSRSAAAMLVALTIGLVVLSTHLSIRDQVGSSPAVDGKALGRSYIPALASSLGDAWLAAADALEQGKSIAESEATFQTTWQSARNRAFASRIVPEFSRILPEGTEPTNSAHRAAVVQLWRDFASGLKGGR